MIALIKRASICVFLVMSVPFAASADLSDAQRALLTGQFSQAFEFAKDIADTHPIDAALLSAHLLLAIAQRHQGKDFYAELNFRRALDIADTPVDRRIARDALRYVRD